MEGKKSTTLFHGIRWVAFLCAFESAATWSADDAFPAPSYCIISNFSGMNISRITA